MHLEKAIEWASNYARDRHVYAYSVLNGWVGHLEDPAPPPKLCQRGVCGVAVVLKPKLKLRPDHSVGGRVEHNIDANMRPVVGNHRQHEQGGAAVV